MISVAVRPIREVDLPLVTARFPFGPIGKHAERLERQRAEQAMYLVAWLAGDPVGHALLKWAGASEQHLLAHFRGTCPDVEDLFVLESLRSRGVGTQLLRAAERAAREQGYARIGLSVDVRNAPARALYERLGYVDAGFLPHTERGAYIDAHGQRQTWEETCVYLVKDLFC